MPKVVNIVIADLNRYSTVKQAAESLQVSESTIRNYLSTGVLTTYKFSTLTLLKTFEVEGRRRSQGKDNGKVFY
jgi:excisionase family DNA binding protein